MSSQRVAVITVCAFALGTASLVPANLVAQATSRATPGALNAPDSALATGPVASGIRPSTAPHGARVVLIGAGLDATVLTVTFSGSGGTALTAPVYARTSTLLEVGVPPAAITGLVSVRASTSPVATFPFTVSPDPAFALVQTLATGFKNPLGTCVRTPDGTVYVADTQHHQIASISLAGQVSILAGSGHPGDQNGAAAVAQFKEPSGLAYDPARQALYVADTQNHRIRKIDLVAGMVSTLAGSGHPGDTDGTGTAAELKEPQGLAIDSTGALVVADTKNDKIRRVTPDGVVTTIAGTGHPGFVDGPAAQASFKEPQALVITSAGVIYVADTSNDAIRKLQAGSVSTLTGIGGDGAFHAPAGITLDDAENLLVADTENNTLRKIDLVTGAVSTIAGSHDDGLVDGAPSAARFRKPAGLSFAGLLAVADNENNAARAVYQALALTAVYPPRGPVAGGNQLRLFGTGFVPGRTQVKLGTAPATGITFASSTEILVTVPAGSAGSVDIVLTTPAGTATLAGGYTYLNPPTLTNVNPTKGKTAGGEGVVVRGSEFLDPDTTLLFGINLATAVVLTSPSRIDANTPAGTAGSVDVSVTTAGGMAKLPNGFTYLDPPTISTITPTQGRITGGATVTITGTNFSDGDTGITFGTTPATSVTVTNPTSLTAAVPAGTPGTVDVTVTTPGGVATLAGAFTYLNPPTVTAITPAQGKVVGGATVTITGTNFAAGASVTFGATAATNVTITSPTTLTATVPAGTAGPVDVSVTTPGGTATLAAAFTYFNPPTVSAIAPTKGKMAGGYTATFTGTNFAAGSTSVSFGSNAAVGVVVATATSLTATVPAGAAGQVDVSVTTPGGTATLAGGFTYLSPPTITSTVPSQGRVSGGYSVTVSGTALDSTATLLFGQNPASNIAVASATQLTATVPAGSPGPVDVTVTTLGGSATLPGAFTYLTPPAITNFTPTSGQVGMSVTITGTGFDPVPANDAVAFNGTPAAVTSASATQLVTSVPAGTTTGKIAVTTTGGVAQSAADFTVVTQTIASLAVTTPAFSLLVGQSQQYTATATNNDGTTSDVTSQATWMINGTAGATVFSGLVSAVAPGWGNVAASFGGRVAFGPLVVSAPEVIPPDPGTIAPIPDPTVPTQLGDATSFLYTGPDAIQKGVAPNTIDFKRVVVIRGMVMNRDGTSLPGARVTVIGHPELGYTVTRADGMFDLAANGGAALALRYDKPGFASASRTVNTPWRDYVAVPDVALVPLDTKVTPIDLTSPLPIQVARASQVSDAAGTRQQTLLFASGTQATMKLPGGGSQALSVLHVRATEYTVGPNGPKAMPAPLPPQSAYTYCVELTVEEAVVASAVQVQFTKPVVGYLENFLGLPVGGTVPSGYFDFTKAFWVAQPDGRVIKVLSITNGMADLDTNGDGSAEDATTLATLGITDDERRSLAGMYQPGQTLWRVPYTHFSSSDQNYPLSSWATPPGLQRPTLQKPIPRGCRRSGSIIECENQILGESIPIQGTPFTLNYRSNRSLGDKRNFTLDIPLTNATLPQGLKRVDLDVRISGRVYHQSFTPQPSLTTSFTWDGKDAYGRQVYGEQPVTVEVSHVFPADYFVTYADFQNFRQSFGRLPGEGTSVLSAPAVEGRAEAEVKATEVFAGSLGVWDPRSLGLGGWTLSPNHRYDFVRGLLELGDGERWGAEVFGSVVSNFAGNGSSGSSGDGGPATSASLGTADFLAAGPDGSVYVSSSLQNCVRKINPAGIITTLVGYCSVNYGALSGPYQVAVGPDNSVYVADMYGQAVKKVAPNGTMSIVAGTAVSMAARQMGFLPHPRSFPTLTVLRWGQKEACTSWPATGEERSIASELTGWSRRCRLLGGT